MALGNDDEAGDSPVVGDFASVGVTCGGTTLVMPITSGTLEKAEDEGLVAEFGGVGPVAVDGEMQTASLVIAEDLRP